MTNEEIRAANIKHCEERWKTEDVCIGCPAFVQMNEGGKPCYYMDDEAELYEVLFGKKPELEEGEQYERNGLCENS